MSTGLWADIFHPFRKFDAVALLASTKFGLARPLPG
jgi:hypothetical protein